MGERKAYPLSHLEKAREGGSGGVHPLESSWCRSCNNEKMKGRQLRERMWLWGGGGGQKAAKVCGCVWEGGGGAALIVSRCIKGCPCCVSMLKVEI